MRVEGEKKYIMHQEYSHEIKHMKIAERLLEIQKYALQNHASQYALEK